jgi:hypothetical protein
VLHRGHDQPAEPFVIPRLVDGGELAYTQFA